MMTKETRIHEFNAHLKNIASAGWREADDHISTLVEELDEDTFNDVVFGKGVWDSSVENSRLTQWVMSKLLTSIIYKFRDRSDEVLKKSSIDPLKEIILSRGLYTDVSILDHIAKTSVGNTQIVAAQFCSTSTLREITSSKNPKVRKIAFQRLGPVECLDLMLSDKMADIREEGVRMAPFGYEKLNSMTKEIARGPFSELVGKISSEYLPMLLANRNLKNKWISKRLQTRLNIEGGKDVG